MHGGRASPQPPSPGDEPDPPKGFLSLAPPPLRGTRVVVQEVYEDGARLAELAALVDAGTLSLRIAATFALEKAAEAHALLEGGALRGRVVLVP